jgi:hypothetical protein
VSEWLFHLTSFCFCLNYQGDFFSDWYYCSCPKTIKLCVLEKTENQSGILELVSETVPKSSPMWHTPLPRPMWACMENVVLIYMSRRSELRLPSCQSLILWSITWNIINLLDLLKNSKS